MKKARKLYESPSGDRWYLIRDHTGAVFVRHEANVASGGNVEHLEVGAFLTSGQGPEQQELEHVQFSPSRVGVPVRGQECESLVLFWTEDEHGAGLQSGFAGPGDRRGAGGLAGPARGPALWSWDCDSHRLGKPGSALG